MAADNPQKVLLVCSPGGHLLQMQRLRPAWEPHDVTWVTLPGSDVEYLLAGEQVVLANGPTNRSLRNLVRNSRLAWRLIRDERPDVILSTGAALAVPFFVVGKLRRCQLIYVESLTRTTSLSLSGRMVYPLVNVFYVQWPGAAGRRRRARCVGNLL